jgi:hypothetical protein
MICGGQASTGQSAGDDKSSSGACVVVASNRSDIDRRVARAAAGALAQRRFVTAIDVLVGVGWLEPRRVDEWRQGRVD